MNKLKLRIGIGILMIMIGISFISSDYIALKREETFTKVNIELNDLLALETNNTIEEEPEPVQQQPEEQQPEEVTTPEPEKQYERFAGILEIPKINFSKGFYQKGSELNNVKFNLKILDVSSYPDEERGNVIIIGHSGNYNNSYFGNLYQLAVNDTASIIYNEKTYRYKVVNIYNEDKDGTVTIYRDGTKNCLTLITCTKDDETKQTVYILERYSVE